MSGGRCERPVGAHRGRPRMLARHRSVPPGQYGQPLGGGPEGGRRPGPGQGPQCGAPSLPWRAVGPKRSYRNRPSGRWGNMRRNPLPTARLDATDLLFASTAADAEYVRRLKAVRDGSYYCHHDSTEREMLRSGEVGLTIRADGRWEFTLMQRGNAALQYYGEGAGPGPHSSYRKQRLCR